MLHILKKQAEACQSEEVCAELTGESSLALQGRKADGEPECRCERTVAGVGLKDPPASRQANAPLISLIGQCG